MPVDWDLRSECCFCISAEEVRLYLVLNEKWVSNEEMLDFLAGTSVRSGLRLKEAVVYPPTPEKKPER